MSLGLTMSTVACNSISNVNSFSKNVHPYGISYEVYEEILNNSLTSIGNNYRLKAFLSKIRNTDDVYITAIGGSVTEGAGPEDFHNGYAYQFVNRLKEEYSIKQEEKIHFNNAGLSGSPSPLALVRYQKDVIDVFSHNPDLLIIEFAVNDSGEVTATRAFEEIIRRALSENPICAVIVLYAAAEYGITQNQMSPVATYYGVQQVSVSDAINLAFSKSLLSKKDYFTDNVHPTLEGHVFMTDCLMNLLNKIDSAEEDTAMEIPENAFKNPDFKNLQRIDANNQNVEIIPGDFNMNDPDCQTVKKTGKSNFPENWYHKSGAGNKSFEMNLECKNLIFVYKGQGNWLPEKFGKAEVYVDGKLFDTYDGGKEGSWNNNEVKLIIDEKECKKHHIEVKMAPGSENLGFTIVAMAYSK